MKFIRKLAPYVLSAIMAAGLVTFTYLLAGTAIPSNKDANTDTLVEYTPGFGAPTEEVEE